MKKKMLTYQRMKTNKSVFLIKTAVIIISLLISKTNY